MDANGGLPPSEHFRTSESQAEDRQERPTELPESLVAVLETATGELETPTAVPETQVGEAETAVGELETTLVMPDTQIGEAETEVRQQGTQGAKAQKEDEELQLCQVGAEVTLERRQRGEMEDVTAPVPLEPLTEGEDENRMMPQQPSHGIQAEVGENQSLQGSMLPADTADFVAVASPNLELPPTTYILSTDNDVVVDATIYPMGFHVLVKAPGAAESKISTRFVFESIASHLHVHPEDIMLYCRSERLRFGTMIYYEQRSSSDKRGRLWVDVHFNEDRIPPHLQGLRKDDHLIRCVHVRARAEMISPADLIAARQRGLNFQQAIDEIRRNTRGKSIVSVAVLHEPRGIALPFLGGYRLKKDPLRIFLHAATQLRSPGDTSIEDLQYGPLPREGVSRRTQTYGISRSCQTLRECYTQTSRPDYEADEKYDELVIAKTYFSAQQLLELQTERAVIIQKMYRKWKARQIFHQLAASHQALLDRAAAEAAADEAEKQRREEFERRRRATPHTADDFATLRRELEAWRAAEAARISSDKTLSEALRRAALLDLTKRELQLLQELEKLCRGAVRDHRIRRFEDILALMTAPKECGSVSVTTMAADRARELRQLFLALIETPSSMEARLDILLHVKWTVKEFDDQLTRQIVELVDRESDLLQRGRTASSLKGLRMRLENLFKRFIATPQYNPAVDEVVKGKTFGAAAGGDHISTAAVAARRLRPSNVIS